MDASGSAALSRSPRFLTRPAKSRSDYPRPGYKGCCSRAERAAALFRGSRGPCECRLDYGRASDPWLIWGIRTSQPRLPAASSLRRASGTKDRVMKLFGCRWSFWSFATNLAGTSHWVYYSITAEDCSSPAFHPPSLLSQ